MSIADAKRAVDIGATAIMVSNHGGRQLDGSRSPFDQFAEIVDAVGDRIDVVCDGGITRGTHVLKALSLGAKACSGGRFYLYANANLPNGNSRRQSCRSGLARRGVDYLVGTLRQSLGSTPSFTPASLREAKMSAVLRFATIPSLAPLAAIEIGRHLVQEGDRWFIVIPPPLPHQPQPPDSASRDRILPIGCATADGQYWAAKLDRDKARISWRCSDSFRAMAAPINPVAPVTRIFMVPPSANQMPILAWRHWVWRELQHGQQATPLSTQAAIAVPT